MSQFPHAYGYGQYHSQHGPPPYGSQNPMGYAVPGPMAPFSGAAQLHRDATQAAYESNAMNIPGLGIGGAAPSTRYPGFGSDAPAWIQPPSFPTPAPAPAPTHASASARNTPHSQPYQVAPTCSQVSEPGPVTTSLSTQPAVVPTRTSNKLDSEIEEGELSEGQFEDLYEPLESVPEAPSRTVPKHLPVAGPSQPESAADTPDGGFYGTDEDDDGRDLRHNEARDRSASYSPFLSPREAQDKIASEISTPQAAADKPVPRGHIRPAVDVPKLAVPSLKPTVLGLASNGSAQPAESVSQPPKDHLSAFRSLQELRKEAQKAILRLWPLGVKYQSYIDEGFDEKVIKALFHDLNLDMPKTAEQIQSHQARKSESREEGEVEPIESSQPSGIQPQQSAPVSKEPSTRGGQSDKAEERKDRIARLLAAKAAKAPLPPKPSAPAPAEIKRTVTEPSARESATALSDSAPPKSKTWGEKERLIQQKIAALQKSRETQAQKSTADTVRPRDPPANTNGSAVSHATATDNSALVFIPTGSKATESSLPAVGDEPSPLPPRPPLASLALTSNVQPNASAQRKRPVASDFVEYSSDSAPAKRPFGQARTETSLIIDVSDESDDEEMDIDMDMGSPADESASFQPSGASGQRGPAIRDFPPLTDIFTQRQFSSPAPSVTPPNGAGLKRRETELDMKEKAIQDMRRKIALAEARRKAKQATGGSVTPRPGGSTSDLKENDTPRVPGTDRAESTSSLDRLDEASLQLTPEPSSSKLLKPCQASQLDPLQRAERRGRIVSLEIPRVESSLKEKLDQLQRLQDEQARLQAEIERSVAEKKRLADELQGLVVTPAESPQPNGLDSAAESVAEEAGAGQQETEFSVLQGGTASAQAPSFSPVPSASASEGSRDVGDTSEPFAELSRRASAPSADDSVGDAFEPATDRAERGPDAPAIDTPASQGFLEPLAEAEAGVHAHANSARDVQSPPLLDEAAENKTPAPDLTEQPVNAGADEATPMELDSRSPSAEAAEAISGSGTADEATETRQATAPLPDQISSVAQPREAFQEIETEATGEIPHEAAAKSASTLTPYESPLRYFHAYRFHPEYQRAVAGGLKSLTYSNRIDPDREICPYELNGEACPPNCEFQHFRAISPPDDQILLELGNPDDYSGEEKTRFIQGLRELLQKFKADKVKDFDTIARGIIEFRSQLLGDKSKVLRLDGVTI